MRLTASLALLALLCGSWATAAPLKLCFENVAQAPWTMPDASGLNFELLRRVEKLTGEQFQFHARPWIRCMEETRTGAMDAMIGAADSPERRLFSRLPILPDGRANPDKALYEDRVDVFLREGSGAAWDGKDLVNPRAIAVAQRGYFVGDLLRARGQSVIDNIKSAEEGLRVLAAGSADVAVLLGRSAEKMVQDDPRFAGRITLAPQPFTQFAFYLMVGRKTYAANPARIEAIWNAIATVRIQPDYRKLEAAATH
ncbi:MAG: transporter substrate-binding domain-containing protein [Pseudomonadota bacterium]